MTALLEVRHLAADIGQFHILQDITFAVPEGAVTVLLGRNGAGKTTTLRTLMGYLKAHSGEVVFAGESWTDLPTHKRAARGVAYVPEDANIFADLTVEENLRLSRGVKRKPGSPSRGSDGPMEAVVDVFPDLRAAWRRLAGTLSGGQRQMLAVAGAIVQEPRCLLIDEPSKGLSPLFVERLADVLESLHPRTTVLLVEQNFYLASRVGQTFALIDDGQTVATGPMTDLIASDDLKQRYLGVRVAERRETP